MGCIKQRGTDQARPFPYVLRDSPDSNTKRVYTLVLENSVYLEMLALAAWNPP